jgi:hypothetical protein
MMIDIVLCATELSNHRAYFRALFIEGPPPLVNEAIDKSASSPHAEE